MTSVPLNMSNGPIRSATPPLTPLILSKETWSPMPTPTPSSSASNRPPGAYPRTPRTPRTPHLSTYLTPDDVEFESIAPTKSKSDVLTGHLVKTGKLVALKRISKESSKRYSTEAEIWRRLKHANVLEFIGILQAGDERFLVSPWEVNGSLAQYLRDHPDADRPRLLRETAAALVYLHRKANIVHGNIRASNILVSHTITALLCDFGLSLSKGLNTPLTNITGESLRWRSLELIESTSKPRGTFESDIYAFGMTIYQVLSGHVPFYEIHHMEGVLIAIKRGDRPPKGIFPNGALHDTVWEVGVSCWAEDPQKRPSAEVAYARLVEVAPLRPGSPDMRAANPSAGPDNTAGTRSPRSPSRSGSGFSIMTWPGSKNTSPWSIWTELRSFFRRQSSGSGAGYGPGATQSEPINNVDPDAVTSSITLCEEPGSMSAAEGSEGNRLDPISEVPVDSVSTTPDGEITYSLPNQVDIGHSPISPVSNPISHDVGQVIPSSQEVPTNNGSLDISTVKEVEGYRLDSVPKRPAHGASPLAGGQEALSVPYQPDISDVSKLPTSSSVVDGRRRHVPSTELEPNGSNHPEGGPLLHQPSLAGPTNSPIQRSYVADLQQSEAGEHSSPNVRTALVPQPSPSPSSSSSTANTREAQRGTCEPSPKPRRRLLKKLGRVIDTGVKILENSEKVRENSTFQRVKSRLQPGAAGGTAIVPSAAELVTSSVSVRTDAIKPNPISAAAVDDTSSDEKVPSILAATSQHDSLALPAMRTPIGNPSPLAGGAYPGVPQLTSTRRAPDLPGASNDPENQPHGDHVFSDRVFPLKVTDYGFKDGDKRRKIVKIIDIDNPTPLPPPAPGGFLRPLDAEEIARLDREGGGDVTPVADATHAPGFVTGWYRALHSFKAEGANEISLTAGDMYECDSRGGTPGDGWLVVAQLVGRRVTYGLAPERYLTFVRQW